LKNRSFNRQLAFGNRQYPRVTDGTRTRDVQDHNLALCQLSYGHRVLVKYFYWPESDSQIRESAPPSEAGGPLLQRDVDRL
jgi:hypothetical protein